MKKKRLTRQDWIDAAIKRLLTIGVDAVRIEPLAEEIGVSRGSFYWHFKSRRELLTAILEDWRQHQTRRIVERIRRDGSLSPIERVVRLRMLPPRTKTTSAAATFELAIRAWAMRDKFASKIVNEVDSERLAFGTALLADAVLVDLPRHMVARHPALLGQFDELVLVTDPTLVGLRDGCRLLRLVRARFGDKKTYIVVNHREQKAEVSDKEMEKGLEAKVDAKLNYARDAVLRSEMAGEPLAKESPKHPLVQALTRLTVQLAGVREAPKRPSLLSRFAKR